MATSTASERRARLARAGALLVLAACAADSRAQRRGSDPEPAASAAEAAPGAEVLPVARFEYERPGMGTLFRIVLHAQDRARADAAARLAFARLDELEAALSDYAPESELSRLSQAGVAPLPTAWIAVSPDLGAVLERARAVSLATGGAFDATCGVATRLWRRALRERELPSPEDLERARTLRDPLALELEPAREPAAGGEPPARRVRWKRAGLRLDLGGIAKGYTLDRMQDVLRAQGVRSALVVGGGDVVASDPPPGEPAWRVELASPLFDHPGAAGTLALARAAVATSGDAQQSARIDGGRRSHLVDPRTGACLDTPRGASVIAPDGATADALATAAAVLGPRGSPELWARFEDCAFRAVAAEGAGVVCVESPGFWGRGAR